MNAVIPFDRFVIARLKEDLACCWLTVEVRAKNGMQEQLSELATSTAMLGAIEPPCRFHNHVNGGARIQSLKFAPSERELIEVPEEVTPERLATPLPSLIAGTERKQRWLASRVIDADLEERWRRGREGVGQQSGVSLRQTPSFPPNRFLSLRRCRTTLPSQRRDRRSFSRP